MNDTLFNDFFHSFPLAEYSRDFITSVVIGNDMVPRLALLSTLISDILYMYMYASIIIDYPSELCTT